MFDKSLAYHIEKLLSDYEGNYFKTKDIAKIIKIKKHKYKDLTDTLSSLVRQKRISRKNQSFGMEKQVSGEDVQTGIFDARSLVKNKSFAFVITPEGEDIYVSAEDTLTAYHGDTVEITVNKGRNGKRYGRIIKIVSRAREQFAGTLRKLGNATYLIADNGKIHTDFVVRDAGDAKSGKKVLLKIVNWGSKELQKLPVGDVVQVLGDAGNPEVEILAVIYEYGLPLEFPDDVINEALAVSNVITPEMLAQRTDLRGLLTFTIDPVSARDYDDAISIVQDGQNTVLYVHIADVAEYVKKGSKLFTEAMQRGNSYYFPRKVIPMLPSRLSNGVCSLRPDEDKLTMTVETHFSPSGAVVKQSVYESIICSDARLTYEQVDDLFDDKPADIADDVAAALQQARKLSALLSGIRYKAGYLRFDLPESEYEFDDEGHLKAIHRSKETDSHRLIENFMLVANEYVCTRLSVAETLYRIHEQPDEQRIEAVLDIISKYNIDVYFQDDLNKTLQLALEELKTEAYHRVFDRQILRSLKRARYSIENKGHFGLAMNTYTHFTSPIRRLCDLVVHHQIKDMLHREPAQFTRKELFELAGRATEREMVADESEREVEWKSKRAFMRKKLGEEFSGIVVGVTPGKLLVELDPFPVVGVVDLGLVKRERFDYYEQYGRLVGRKTGMLIGLADPVKVMVSNVSDDIYFQLLV